MQTDLGERVRGSAAGPGSWRRRRHEILAGIQQAMGELPVGGGGPSGSGPRPSCARGSLPIRAASGIV